MTTNIEVLTMNHLIDAAICYEWKRSRVFRNSQIKKFREVAFYLSSDEVWSYYAYKKRVYRVRQQLIFTKAEAEILLGGTIQC